MLDDQIRLDGRKTTEIRPISSEVGYLPGFVHMAQLYRGGMSLTTLTLEALDIQRRWCFGRGRFRLLLHYNFPPFSTRGKNEFSVSGRWAWYSSIKSIKPMIPGKPENPYTIGWCQKF